MNCCLCSCGKGLLSHEFSIRLRIFDAEEARRDVVPPGETHGSIHISGDAEDQRPLEERQVRQGKNAAQERARPMTMKKTMISSTAMIVGFQSPLNSSPPVHHFVGGSTKITSSSPANTRNEASAVCATGRTASSSSVLCAQGHSGPMTVGRPLGIHSTA